MGGGGGRGGGKKVVKRETETDETETGDRDRQTDRQASRQTDRETAVLRCPGLPYSEIYRLVYIGHWDRQANERG